MINYQWAIIRDQRSEVRGQRPEKREERNDKDSRWLSEVEATNINKKICESGNRTIEEFGRDMQGAGYTENTENLKGIRCYFFARTLSSLQLEGELRALKTVKL